MKISASCADVWDTLDKIRRREVLTQIYLDGAWDLDKMVVRQYRDLPEVIRWDLLALSWK